MNWITVIPRKSNWLTLFLVVLFAFAIFEARDYSRGAQFFPLMVAIAGLVLCLIQLFLDMWRIAKGKEETVGGFIDIATDESIPTSVIYKRGLRYLLWILALYAGMWVLGFKIATALFFIVFLKVEGRSRWLTIGLLTAGAIYLTFVHFENIMSVHWPESLLGEWLEFPWLD